MTDPARYYAELLRSITDTTLYRVARVMIDHQGEDRAITYSDGSTKTHDFEKWRKPTGKGGE